MIPAEIVDIILAKQVVSYFIYLATIEDIQSDAFTCILSEPLEEFRFHS
jgi:hypothetical protein